MLKSGRRSYEESIFLRNLNVDPNLKSDYSKICKKVSKEFNKNLENDEYEFESKSKNVDELTDLIKERNLDSALAYGKTVIIWVIFLAFSVISFILWMFYCCFCTCCQNCCCCCSANKKGNCCDIFSLIATIISYSLVIILAIASLTISKKFMQGFNGSFCGLYKFYEITLDGEREEKPMPRWNGIDNVANLLKEVERNAINPIQKASSILVYDAQLVELHPNGRYDKCEVTFNKNDINQQYLYEYCNAINKQYKAYTGLRGYVEGVQGYEVLDSNAFVDNINNLKEKVLEGKVKDIVKMLGKIAPIINNYGQKIFLAFSVILIVVAAVQLLMILLTRFLSVKICFFKFLFHLIWNLVCLFTIFLFIIGAIFGLLGSIGSDVLGVVSFLFSHENLYADSPVLIPKPEDNQGEGSVNYIHVIDECINGHGNLSDIFDLSKKYDYEELNGLIKMKEQFDIYLQEDPNSIYNVSAIPDIPGTVEDIQRMQSYQELMSKAFTLSATGFNNLMDLFQDEQGNVIDDLVSVYNCRKIIYFIFI